MLFWSTFSFKQLTVMDNPQICLVSDFTCKFQRMHAFPIHKNIPIEIKSTMRQSKT